METFLTLCGLKIAYVGEGKGPDGKEESMVPSANDRMMRQEFKFE